MSIIVKTLKVKMRFVSPILGTASKNKEIYEQFILSKLREEAKKGRISKEELEKRTKEELETVQETEDKGWTIFCADDDGLLLYSHMVKGFLKAAAYALIGQVKGITVYSHKSLINSQVFPVERKLRLVRPDGQIIKVADEINERPLRATTMQGDRVTLCRSDQVNPPFNVDVTLRIIERKDFTAAVVKELLSYGAFQGLGQWRSAGYGQFEVEIAEV